MLRQINVALPCEEIRPTSDPKRNAALKDACEAALSRIYCAFGGLSYFETRDGAPVVRGWWRGDDGFYDDRSVLVLADVPEKMSELALTSVLDTLRKQIARSYDDRGVHQKALYIVVQHVRQPVEKF